MVAIVKNELQREASLYAFLQRLSASVVEKAELSCTSQLDDAA
jgi:hypothetical protein